MADFRINETRRIKRQIKYFTWDFNAQGGTADDRYIFPMYIDDLSKVIRGRFIVTKNVVTAGATWQMGTYQADGTVLDPKVLGDGDAANLVVNNSQNFDNSVVLTPINSGYIGFSFTGGNVTGGKTKTNISH